MPAATTPAPAEVFFDCCFFHTLLRLPPHALMLFTLPAEAFSQAATMLFEIRCQRAFADAFERLRFRLSPAERFLSRYASFAMPRLPTLSAADKKMTSFSPRRFSPIAAATTLRFSLSHASQMHARHFSFFAMIVYYIAYAFEILQAARAPAIALRFRISCRRPLRFIAAAIAAIAAAWPPPARAPLRHADSYASR